MSIPLADGRKLVVDLDKEYEPERLYIGIEDKDRRYTQDICAVGPANKERDLLRAYLWEDHESDDFTYDGIIGIYKEEN